MPCHFHENRESPQICHSCGRQICKACETKGYCWACYPLVQGTAITSVGARSVATREVNYNKGKLSYRVQRMTVLTDSATDVVNINGLTCLGIPEPLENMKIVYFDVNNEMVNSLWADPVIQSGQPQEPTSLLYSANDIKHFSSFFAYFLTFLAALIPGALLFIFAQGLQSVIKALSTVVVLFFGWPFLNSLFIYPNRWDSKLTEFQGTIVSNSLNSWNAHFSNNNIPEWLEFSVINSDNGATIEKGWRFFLRVKRADVNKIVRVVVEGTGECPYFQNTPKPGETWEFKGRELYNVLVCNLALFPKEGNDVKQAKQSRAQKLR